MDWKDKGTGIFDNESEQMDEIELSAKEQEVIKMMQKKGEELDIPESLRPENMMKRIENLKQDENRKQSERAKQDENMKQSEHAKQDENMKQCEHAKQSENAKWNENTKQGMKKRGSWWKKGLASAACIALIAGSVYGAASMGMLHLPGRSPESELGGNTSQVLSSDDKSYASIANKLESCNRDRIELEGAIADDTMNELTNGSIKGNGNNEESFGQKPGTNDSVNEEDDFTSTNIQVEGIDEGDVVKCDGHYIYVLSVKTGQCDIIRVSDNTKIATIESEKREDVLNYEMFVKDNRLVIIAQVYKDFYAYEKPIVNTDDGATDSAVAEDITDYGEWTEDGYWPKEEAVISIYDLADRMAPTLVKTTTLEGSIDHTRLVDNMLYMAVNVSIYGDITEDNCVPRIDGEQIEADCVYLPEVVHTAEYIMAVSMDINGDGQVKDKSAVVLSDYYYGGGAFYMSSDNMYVTTIQSGTEGFQTVIWRMKYENGEIESPVNGKVKGIIHNQFAMDEYEGFLRTVTTYWDDGNYENVNMVHVLRVEDMKEVGTIDNIARDESIYSVRFEGNIGYFVTFRQIDPLFKVDFSNPEKPVILGELEVTGYSSYLHKYAQGLLLGIGREDAKLKFSMFKDDDSLSEIARYCIDDAMSKAEDDHKALFISPENNMFGMMINTWEYKEQRLREEEIDSLYYATGDTYAYEIYGFENNEFVKRLSVVLPVVEEGDYWWEELTGTRCILAEGKLFILYPGNHVWVYDAQSFEMITEIEL